MFDGINLSYLKFAGVAACHIGGITLHQFAGIGKGEASLERCYQIVSRTSALQVWRKCKHLIIDEVSMIDGDYFAVINFVFALKCIINELRWILES